MKGTRRLNSWSLKLRLIDDRNEHKAYSQLYEELWENEEYGRHEEGEEATPKALNLAKPKALTQNSRREADKVVVPPWPKSHDSDGWKSQLLSNVLSAGADTSRRHGFHGWEKHLRCTPIFDSDGPRFTTIDVKLANALNAMITFSGDSGKEVGMEIKVMTLDLAEELLLGFYEAGRKFPQFYSYLTFTGKHLYKMTHPGDNKLSLFRNHNGFTSYQQ